LNQPPIRDDVAVVSRLQTSLHGCSETKTSHGLWYKFMHDKNQPHESYSIVAMNVHRSKISNIEFPTECNSFKCTGDTQIGQAVLTFPEGAEYQYLFVYPSETDSQEGLIVSIVKQEPTTNNKCSSARTVDLPFTLLSAFTDADEPQQLPAANINAPAHYFKVAIKASGQHILGASTCFPKTITNTGIEIDKSCTEGLTYNSEGRTCSYGAAAISLDVEGNVEYILAVYSETVSSLKLKQYRLVIYHDVAPSNSKCSTADSLDNLYYFRKLNLNRMALPTNLKEDNQIIETRGHYFKFRRSEDYVVSVKTCSVDTTMDSMIIVTKECTTKDDISTPSKLVNVATASVTNCDVHGTELSFDAAANTDYYILAVPENPSEEGFIDVQIYMDKKDEDDDDSSYHPQDDSSYHPPHPQDSDDDEPDNDRDDDDNKHTPVGWIIFGVLFYVLFTAVLVALVVSVILKRRTASGYAVLN